MNTRLTVESSPVELVNTSWKRAIVTFDTRYGNTEKIARSFEAGLEQSGIATSCLNAKEVNSQLLKEYDLLAFVGVMGATWAPWG